MKYICEHVQRMCKASGYWKMTHKCLYLSITLLFVLNIKNYRYKMVEQNKCSDMANCWLTYGRWRVFFFFLCGHQGPPQRRKCRVDDAFRSKKGSSALLLYEKEMPSKFPLNCLWLRKWNIYVNTMFINVINI